MQCVDYLYTAARGLTRSFSCTHLKIGSCKQRIEPLAHGSQPAQNQLPGAWFVCQWRWGCWEGSDECCCLEWGQQRCSGGRHWELVSSAWAIMRLCVCVCAIIEGRSSHADRWRWGNCVSPFLAFSLMTYCSQCLSSGCGGGDATEIREIAPCHLSITVRLESAGTSSLLFLCGLWASILPFSERSVSRSSVYIQVKCLSWILNVLYVQGAT